MRSFEKFFFEKVVIPTTIPINIKGVGELNAKADTGNGGYNVIHATNIAYTDGQVSFDIGDNHLQLPCSETLNVRKGPNIQEDRHVVKFDVAVSDRVFEDVPFTLTDRSGMIEPVLLSQQFLSQMDALVDPSE